MKIRSGKNVAQEKIENEIKSSRNMNDQEEITMQTQQSKMSVVKNQTAIHE